MKVRLKAGRDDVSTGSKIFGSKSAGTCSLQFLFPRQTDHAASLQHWLQADDSPAQKHEFGADLYRYDLSSKQAELDAGGFATKS